MGTKNTILLFLFLFVITPIYSQLYINEIIAANKTILADANGEYDDWIEIYNNSNSPINIAGYHLSDDPLDPTQYKIPSSNAAVTTIPANGYLLFWADNDTEQGENHTNFKLSSGGGSVHLYSPNGTTLIDEFTFPAMEDDYSFGRKTDGANELVLFSQSSPLSSNSNGASLTASPVINPSGGLYSSNQSVTISSTTSGATIYYTIDGSVPTTSSTVYSGPISLSNSKSIRAIAVKNGFENSELITESYIFYSTQLPIITITSDPDGLWSDNNGIHVIGTNGIDGNCMPVPANFNQDWERAAAITMIETDGTEVFNTNAGLAIAGGCSRGYPMKSFNISCKSIYGSSNFEHQIFPDYEQDKYKRIKLRNGGNEFENLHMRDVIAQSLILDEIDIDQQRIRPAVVFINGEYWGIMNIRDVVSEHYIDETHQIADKDSIDLLKPTHDVANVLEGSATDYNALYSYINDNDMADQSKYKYVKTKIDIKEYINYHIIQIYGQNTDWPNNNMKIWREQSPESKYRWILYDTDWTFGYTRNEGNSVTQGDYKKDALSFATDPNGQGWPNDATSTMFLRKLLENEEFKNEFTQRFATQMATLFEVNRAQAIADKRYNEVISEKQKHFDRWNGTKEDRGGYAMVLNMTKWQKEFDYVRSWMGLRQPYMKQHIQDYFGIGGTYLLDIPVTAQTNGHVVLNNNEYPAPYNYSGEYFDGIPMRIRAIPNPGYRFSHWLETSGTNPVHVFTKSGNTTRTPVFVAAEDLVINEIHYNPIDGTKEFIEIYNRDNNTKNISGYNFSEGVHFTFPEGATIAAGEHIIIADNATHYSGNGYQVFEWAYSNLSNDGEVIVLQNPVKLTVDSIAYNDANPWDKAPDGKDYSLELLHPTLDKSNPLNWFRSDAVGGTPGFENSRICSNAATSIVINEINYNSDNINFDPSDWVELYNPNGNAINISGWTFYDSDSAYVIPSGTSIPANGYLILVEDVNLFSTAFPNIPSNKYIGGFKFSLDKDGERISLFNRNKCLSDYVVYNDQIPWPENLIGQTLSLLDPNLDNNLGASWEASLTTGTPGVYNFCTPGESCDDGNDCTINDAFDQNCNCVGALQTDDDNDGICNPIDVCANFDDHLIGSPCDDGDPCTVGEKYGNDCNCSGGVSGDQDNDGICDAQDICPTMANNLIGQVCDDGDPNTFFDSYKIETCGCSGIEAFTTVCSQISRSSDDAEENILDGSVTIVSGDLDMVNDEGEIYITGLRFRNINIPQGATITNAYIEFTADEINLSADTTLINIKGQHVNNASTFGISINNISNRTTTSSSVDWQPSSWSTVGNTYQTADVSTIIQEIVNRSGFTDGNAIALILEGTGIRTAESYDGSITGAPELCITYVSGECVVGYPCDDGNAFTVDDAYDADCKCTGEFIGVNARVLFEGFYENANGKMHTKLKDKNLLPLAQPFNSVPWNYNGTETVTSIPSGVVDWILIATRNNNGSVIDQAAGFINQDGDLMGLDGLLGIPINNAIGNKISVHHRSHLAVLSAAPFDGNRYDFTTAVSQAVGVEQLKLNDGKYMLYGGDYDSSGIINNTDFNDWKIQSAKLNEYLPIDGDGNGIINASDYNLWINNRSKIGEEVIRY